MGHAEIDPSGLGVLLFDVGFDLGFQVGDARGSLREKWGRLIDHQQVMIFKKNPRRIEWLDRGGVQSVFGFGR
jgi:hypothetical protein